jgi:hypothetical protein
MATAELQAPRVAAATPRVADTRGTVDVLVVNRGADSSVAVQFSPVDGMTRWSPAAWVSGVGPREASIPLSRLLAGTRYEGVVEVWSSYGTAWFPVRFSTADRTPPSLTAFAAQGRRGRRVRLAWRLADDSGRANVVLAVYRGRRRVARMTESLRLSRSSWSYSWKAPRAAGGYRWCIRAGDPTGNRTPLRCAPITIG